MAGGAGGFAGAPGDPLDPRRAPLDDARWVPGSDPERAWALTLPQPWAELTLRGARWCDDRTGPPPAEMINKVIALHAAIGKPVQKRIDPAGREDAERILGMGFSAACNDLPRGQIVGRVKLVAAFRIGGFGPGRAVYSRLRGNDRHLGDWRACDGRILHRWGDHMPPRWLWVLDPVDREGAGETLRGYAGLFDLVTARALEPGGDRVMRAPVARSGFPGDINAKPGAR